MSASQRKTEQNRGRKVKIKESKGPCSTGSCTSKKARGEYKEERSIPIDKSKASKIYSDSHISTEKTTNHFLSGVRLYILPAGMMKVRIELFTSKLTLYGGIIEKDFDPKCTHVLVDEEMTLDRALRLLKITNTPENTQRQLCPIVQSMWLSDCLKEKSLLPIGDYLLNKPSTVPNPYFISVEKSESNDEYEPPLQPRDQTQNDFPSSLNITKEKTYDSGSDYVPSDDEAELFSASTQLTVTQTTSSGYTPKELPKGNWICFQSSKKCSGNKNQHIIDHLQEMVKTYKSTNDRWRVYSYQKAISALQRFPKEVTTWEEARSLPGIGDSLADKVWEIIESGELRKLKEFQNSEDCQVLNLFTKVWGAGSQTARIWYQLGYRTLNDLKNKANLTSQQKIGLEHYDDFLERMTRDEVAEIEKVIVESTHKLLPDTIIETCGSYRRGKITCGDVDFLISHPDGKSHQGILSKLLALLKEQNFITDDLIEIEENGNQRKYMGVCKLPGENRKYRRIDIIVAPYSEFACALVHFTGSAHFNRSLRHLAKKMEMSLSEHSLRTGVIRGENEKLYKGTILPTPTEESIFQQLGVPYRPPTERDH